jgi:hypothetical protein
VQGDGHIVRTSTAGDDPGELLVDGQDPFEPLPLGGQEHAQDRRCDLGGPAAGHTHHRHRRTLGRVQHRPGDGVVRIGQDQDAGDVGGRPLRHQFVVTARIVPRQEIVDDDDQIAGGRSSQVVRTRHDPHVLDGRGRPSAAGEERCAVQPTDQRLDDQIARHRLTLAAHAPAAGTSRSRGDAQRWRPPRDQAVSEAER